MMTREEAIALFEKQLTAAQVVLDSGFGSNPGENDFLYRRRKEMAEIALSALRPFSREQVERMRGEWEFDAAEPNGKFGGIRCSKCHKAVSFGDENAFHNAKVFEHYCSNCGSPMTDEAVQMVMERMEVLNETT